MEMEHETPTPPMPTTSTAKMPGRKSDQDCITNEMSFPVDITFLFA